MGVRLNDVDATSRRLGPATAAHGLERLAGGQLGAT
jgi:hypothetical protein